MRKGIKIFLEKLKFVKNYQCFLLKIALDYMDFADFSLCLIVIEQFSLFLPIS